jgi:hypothetical protein
MWGPRVYTEYLKSLKQHDDDTMPRFLALVRTSLLQSAPASREYSRIVDGNLVRNISKFSAEAQNLLIKTAR